MIPKNPIVLMYHSVISPNSGIPQDREAGADLYDVSVENFSQHLEAMKETGLAVGRLEDQNPNLVVLTFDDGELNNFTEAFPLLKKFGFVAYFFVTPNRVGKPGYMDWPELRILAQSGMIIGSHSLSHRIMTTLTPEIIKEELVVSKEILEQQLDIPVTDFSVPRGFYNKLILEIAQRAGYKKIFVSAIVKGTENFVVERMAIKNDWTLLRFKQALSGQVPLGERIARVLKDTTKKICGGRVYDQLRTHLLPRK